VRRICVVTTSRADYGIYRPVLREINRRGSLQLTLLVTGSHLSPQFGLTVREIQEDGYDTSQRIEMLLSSDTPEGASKSIGLAIISFADFYSRARPDLLLVLGDRFEMHAAVTASLPFKIPVAHIHGGELTEGAIDDVLRHSITKMSHLHFPATDVYAERIKQMGEEAWRITMSGAPSLDNLRNFQPLDDVQLSKQSGLPIDEPFLLVTYHPVTLEDENQEANVDEMLRALAESNQPVLFTYPNADYGSHKIMKQVEDYVARSSTARIVPSLGSRGYFSMMGRAAAMVGNSSSGIVEAASFHLPVVNIGNRQAGRLRARNVIDVGESEAEISDGLRRALDPAFRDSLADLKNPYGDGHAAERIVDTIESVELNQKLLKKHFQQQ
jgi:UDP-hydrolysing UDP-N-acetyl-D-glucosamine 2-epimerase